MSEFLHAQLAFSQYIAPLMADFMTVNDNNSFVRVFDNGMQLLVSALSVLLSSGLGLGLRAPRDHF